MTDGFRPLQDCRDGPLRDEVDSSDVMVENGHLTPVASASSAAPVVDTGYRNPHCPALGMDTTTLADLRRRTPPELWGVPQRPDFHLLVLVTRGHGTHMIDFTDHECEPHTLLWIRPGQVHRYSAEPGLDARLVLFTPEFPPPRLPCRALLDDPYGPAHWKPRGPHPAALTALFDVLVTAHDQHESGPPGTTTALLRHLLAALLLRISLLPDPVGEPRPAGPGALFTRFRTELEKSFAAIHGVDAYADRLAVAARTLTRACLDATGQSAKHVIDARIALEAKRMLAHTDWPVAAIGRRLGFSEATNFSKFFTRVTGVTPGAFRDAFTAGR